jgi:hypothetical protein
MELDYPNCPIAVNEKQEKSVVGDAEVHQILSKPLPQHHLEMLLEESGISPDVIRERGYLTVTTKQELRKLGFSERQSQLVPALLIPIHSTNGGVVFYQIRPDNPRADKRKNPPKLLKYETPKGAKIRLDVHPRCLPYISNPAVDLWITEGIKKTDTLVSRGCCTVGQVGVWGFMGSNEHGGKATLSDWRDIALNGRLVYIVYDSDAMQKKEVHRALEELAGLLKNRGAKVRVVYLPILPGLDKVGVDDFLIRGYSVDDLVKLSSSELKPLPDGDDGERKELMQSDCATALKDAYQDKFLFAIDRSR